MENSIRKLGSISGVYSLESEWGAATDVAQYRLAYCYLIQTGKPGDSPGQLLLELLCNLPRYQE